MLSFYLEYGILEAFNACQPHDNNKIAHKNQFCELNSRRKILRNCDTPDPRKETLENSHCDGLQLIKVSEAQYVREAESQPPSMTHLSIPLGIQATQAQGKHFVSPKSCS